jgi:hypothetical protein
MGCNPAPLRYSRDAGLYRGGTHRLKPLAGTDLRQQIVTISFLQTGR